MNAELKFTALGGDKIFAIVAGASCSQYGSGNDYRQRSLSNNVPSATPTTLALSKFRRPKVSVGVRAERRLMAGACLWRQLLIKLDVAAAASA